MFISKREIARRRRDALNRADEAKLRQAAENARASCVLVGRPGRDGEEAWLDGKRYWYWRGTWRDWK